MEVQAGTTSAWRRGRTIGILVAVALVYVACIPLSNGDVREHLLRWTAYLIEHGRFAALGDAFSEYAPPYLYLLALGTLLTPPLGQLAVIELVSIAGTVFLGLCMRWLLAPMVDARRAALGGLMTMCVPTVVANGPVWGQCDAIYSGFALLCVGLVTRGRIVGAMAAAGVAVSFKLQGVFVAPLLLAVLLCRPGNWWTLSLLPIAYAAMMVPALIAGRTVSDLALLYVAQGNYFHDLARSVPNMWQVLRAVAPGIPYGVGVGTGLALAVAGAIWLACLGRREMQEPSRILLVALTGAILMPYVLPKMHNRYFFMADVLSLAYAIVAPSTRSRRIAVLTQVASLLAYATFLLHLTGGAFVGAFFMTGAVALVLRELLEALGSQRHVSDGIGAARFCESDLEVLSSPRP